MKQHPTPPELTPNMEANLPAMLQELDDMADAIYEAEGVSRSQAHRLASRHDARLQQYAAEWDMQIAALAA
jgi:hypothetical protein